MKRTITALLVACALLLTAGHDYVLPTVNDASVNAAEPAKLAPAASAKAVIVGPLDNKSEPGDLVVLQATGSVANAYKWTVIPADVAAGRFFEFNEKDATGKVTKSTLVFSCRKSGTFTFCLAVAVDNTLDQTTYTLANGTPGPQPPPEPPTPPTPGPNENPYRPNPQMKLAVDSVLKFDLTAADSQVLASLYGVTATKALATLKTYGDLRSFLVAEGSKLGLQNKYAGLGMAVDGAMLQMTNGKSAKASTPIDKSLTEKALATLAWAVYETGTKK